VDNQEVVQALGIPPSMVEAIVAREQQELDGVERYIGALVQRQCAWSNRHPRGPTGLRPEPPCLRPSKRYERRARGRIVGRRTDCSPEACDQLGRGSGRDHLCVTPRPFHAVGLWYETSRRRPTTRCEVLTPAVERVVSRQHH